MLASSVVVLVLMVLLESLPRLAVVETAMLGTAGRVPDAAAAAAPAAVAEAGVARGLGTRRGEANVVGSIIVGLDACGVVVGVGVAVVVVAANWVGKRG